MSAQQKRIINLQKCLHIAKSALERVRGGCQDPIHVSEDALSNIEEADRELRYGKLQPPETLGQLPRRRK